MLARKNSKTKRSVAFARLLVACYGVLLWLGATRNRSVIRLNDPQTARAEVLKHIPIGSDVRQAESVSEQSDFECALFTNNGYNYKYKKPNIFARAEKYLKNPKLYGLKIIRTLFGLPVSEWSMTISYKNLRVTGVEVLSTPIGYNL